MDGSPQPIWNLQQPGSPTGFPLVGIKPVRLCTHDCCCCCCRPPAHDVEKRQNFQNERRKDVKRRLAAIATLVLLVTLAAGVPTAFLVGRWHGRAASCCHEQTTTRAPATTTEPVGTPANEVKNDSLWTGEREVIAAQLELDVTSLKGFTHCDEFTLPWTKKVEEGRLDITRTELKIVKNGYYHVNFHATMKSNDSKKNILSKLNVISNNGTRTAARTKNTSPSAKETFFQVDMSAILKLKKGDRVFVTVYCAEFLYTHKGTTWLNIFKLSG